MVTPKTAKNSPRRLAKNELENMDVFSFIQQFICQTDPRGGLPAIQGHSPSRSCSPERRSFSPSTSVLSMTPPMSPVGTMDRAGSVFFLFGCLPHFYFLCAFCAFNGSG